MMYPRWLLSTHCLLLCNLNLLSASPITLDDTRGLYPSNPPPSTNITTNLTSLYPITCLPDRDPRRLRPSSADCISAIFGAILNPGPPTIPQKFYDWSYMRGTADFILPEDGFWRHKTCVIAVRDENEQEVGAFSLEEVGFTARDVVMDCVGDEDGTAPSKGRIGGLE